MQLIKIALVLLLVHSNIFGGNDRPLLDKQSWSNALCRQYSLEIDAMEKDQSEASISWQEYARWVLYGMSFGYGKKALIVPLIMLGTTYWMYKTVKDKERKDPNAALRQVP